MRQASTFHFLVFTIASVILCAESKLIQPILPPSTTELLFEQPNIAPVPPSNRANEDYRLPNNTIPQHYAVTLTTNVHSGDRAFQGVVNIELTMVEDTRTIFLHARQLDNFVATIKNKDLPGAVEIKLRTSYELLREFLSLTPEVSTINFPKDSNWILTISYNGTLRGDNGGFYLSSYTDDKGIVHYLATTQFESTNARHAFPCMDEPAKRANFTITIRHSSTYTAISNMPVNKEQSSPGITVFQTTPKMPSYLVAFIVSDFEYTEGSLHGLTQRVFSRKGTQKHQLFGLVSGMLLAESLAYYYDVPFALPKLDQAAIPDFAAGAMENWGLATYREQYLLYSRENSTVNAQTNIANIIGHEYAHMWFGDLVSIKWWTYLWLKEGFATLFSYEADDIAYPDWNIYQIFHVSDYNSALLNDASLKAVPMTHYVQTPNEISARYDTFSYAKPASVLYMFKNAFTDKVFRLGLHKYLSKHKFNSCDEWNLFEALQDAANELNHNLPTTVAHIFSSWSQQNGYPLLTVTRNYNDGSFTVKQEHFTHENNYESSKTWFVPINYAVASSPDFRDTRASHYILNVTELAVKDAKLSKDDWFILNKQSTGYYRVNYDERNWKLISDALISKAHQIHPRNRAQLMNDAYRFVSTGRLSHSTLLYLTSYLRNEDQYAPWSTANSIFTVYDQYLRGDAQYEHFKLFVQQLVENIFDKVGVHDLSGEQHLVKYLRSVLINLACTVGSANCYHLTNKRIKELINDKIRIEPNVESQVYCNGLRDSSDTEFDYIFNELLNSKVSLTRSFYISSLGCSQKEPQLKKLFESSIDKSNQLSYSERTSLLPSGYSRGEVGLTASLEFLEKHWREYGDLSTTAKPLDSTLRGMATYVVNDKQQKRLQALVATVNNTGYVETTLSAAVNRSIDANFAWLKVNRDPLMSWVVHYTKGNGSASLSISLSAIILGVVLSFARFF